MIRTRDDKVHAWYPGSVMHDGASQEAPSLFVFSCFILSRRNGFRAGATSGRQPISQTPDNRSESVLM